MVKVNGVFYMLQLSCCQHSRIFAELTTIWKNFPYSDLTA